MSSYEHVWHMWIMLAHTEHISSDLKIQPHTYLVVCLFFNEWRYLSLLSNINWLLELRIIHKETIMLDS